MKKNKNFRKKKHSKGELRGLQVKVYDNNIEYALKKFKRMVKNSGMMLELKKKQYYEKPSVKRREKKNLAKLRNKYKNQKEEKSY